MKQLRSIGLVLMVLSGSFATAAPGGSPGNRNPSRPPSRNGGFFIYDRGVPTLQREQIEADIEFFEGLQFELPLEASAALMRMVDASQTQVISGNQVNRNSLLVQFREIFGAEVQRSGTTVSGRSLLSWLKTRMQYVLPESKRLERDLVDLGRAQYPSSPLPPISQIATASSLPIDPVSATLVMYNAGAALYYTGKSQSRLVGLRVDGHGVVRVLSPRTGIVGIGEGLFKLPKGTPKTSLPARVYRLSTYFHEARHSDGSGRSLGFLHVRCQSGRLAGHHACDNNGNGPYSVGAVVSALFAWNCQALGCTPAEESAIIAETLDSQQRVIKQRSDGWGDPDGVSELNVMKSLSESYGRLCDEFGGPYCETARQYREKYEALLADRGGNRPASSGYSVEIWDAAPERVL